MGFRDRQKWPQAMRNETTMAMHESCKRNGNGCAMGVQCVRALPLPFHSNGQQPTTEMS
jgi:hypothetical protein